jgi:hypothetical protein
MDHTDPDLQHWFLRILARENKKAHLFLLLLFLISNVNLLLTATILSPRAPNTMATVSLIYTFLKQTSGLTKTVAVFTKNA